MVLSRKLGESIMVGDDIKITVVHSSHGRTRLMIKAPKCIPVHREEIYKKNLLKKEVSNDQG